MALALALALTLKLHVLLLFIARCYSMLLIATAAKDQCFIDLSETSGQHCALHLLIDIVSGHFIISSCAAAATRGGLFATSLSILGLGAVLQCSQYACCTALQNVASDRFNRITIDLQTNQMRQG